MNAQEYIESGVLELYVFGVLNETETKEISTLEKSEMTIKNEIIAIEKSILNLSSSFAPNVSPAVFDKIKTKLELKHNVASENKEVIQLQPKNNFKSYLGWAASLLFLLSAGYFYDQSNKNKTAIVAIEKSTSRVQKSLLALELKNKSNEIALNVIRDKNKKIIVLAGQTISPTSYAKVYCDPKTKEVFVDASGLPEPPDGMVYQLWSLKMNPLTPTSLGLLADYKNNSSKMFTITTAGADGAEGFGITLEPAGGSKTPTMEQLYALGTTT